VILKKLDKGRNSFYNGRNKREMMRLYKKMVT